MGFHPMYAWPSASCRSRSPVRAKLTSIECVPPRYGKSFESTAKSEDDVNKRLDFDRLVAEQRRLVAPLEHGVPGRLDKEGRAGDDFELLDASVFRDDGVHPHRALNARLPRQRRIDGVNLIDDLGFLHARTDLEALGSFGLGRRGSAAGAAENSAHH